MNDKDFQTDELTALHEAAHAVGSHRGGFTPLTVSIERRDGTLGRENAYDGPHDEASTERYVIALLAGYAADLRSGVPEAIARLGASNDFEIAESFVEALPQNEALWIAKAVDFVSTSENWSAIERLARELLEHRTLDMDEISIILNAADGVPDMDIEEFRAMRASAFPENGSSE